MSRSPRISGGFIRPIAGRVLFAPICALGILLSASGAQAQAVSNKLWITDGGVHAVVTDGSTLYIGGSFSRVGPATGGGVPIDASTALPIADFPLVSGTVYAVVGDGSGGFFIGGSFTRVGGLARQNLAHVDFNMQVTAWNPSPDHTVRALVLDGGVLYVGGLFSNIGGQARQGIAAINPSTGLATSWYPGATNIVYALALGGSTLYMGGSFCCVGGNFRSDIAAVDIPTGTVKSWNPNANGHVFSLSVIGSTVYVGGQFSSIGGQSRNRLAALDATTGLATSWNPAPNGTVWAIFGTGSVIYVGGDFITIGGQSRNYIAAIDPIDGSATSWNPNANDTVLDLQRIGSRVYAGGEFSSIGGQPRNRIAELDATTGSASSWNPSANNIVECLLTDGFVVFVGGSLTSVGGVIRNNIAALDLASGVATGWNPNANSVVQALAIAGQTVYAGGQFTNVGGQTRNRIAALSASTGLATSWNPNANNAVAALSVSGNLVYAGGWFTIIAGQPRNFIAALDAVSGANTSWNPNANNSVYALASSGTTVYAGGSFTAIGGQARNSIAALDAGSGLPTAWNPNANSNVLALAVGGNTVYAGGDFGSIGGQARSGIAALDAGTGLATTWNPNSNGSVYALSVRGTTVYAGGSFANIGGKARTAIAALQGTTGSALPWNPGANNPVNALLVTATTVYAGGNFSLMGGAPLVGIAAINAAPSLESVVPATGGNAGPVTLSVNGEGLAAWSSISLTRSGEPAIPGVNPIAAADGSNIKATFYLDGALPGLWSLTFYHSDGQIAVLTDGFTIEEVEGPQLRVGIVGTSLIGGNPVVRRDRRTAFDLVIENPGNVDAWSVPLWLAGVPLDATVELDFALSYPPQFQGQPDWSTVPLFFTSSSGKYLPIVIPRVPPGTTTRRIYLTVPGPTHPPFQLIAAVAPPWVDGVVFRSCLSPAAGIGNPTCMGTQLDGLNAHLAANPGIEGLSGIAWWAKIAWVCEGAGTLPAALVKAEQVLDYLEGSVQSGTSTAGCENVSRPRWRDVQMVSVVGSVDPNEKIGLQGSFAGQTVLPYTIRFENFSTATLPAQDVIVTDQLNGSVLELSTLSLDQITFGNRHIYPPPGLTSFSTTVDLRPQKNLLVNVSASLDPITQVVSWHFSSIDPATGRTPADLQMGFLPPNNVPPEGEGSVMFTVMPKPGLATGTQISNAASIVFDDPPATNTLAWTNGVDNSPPASNVLPIPPQSHLPSIPVSWGPSGAPSDLRDYTIYVKQDTGPYRVWRLNTPTTSDTLVPPQDHKLHTFSFYSVARDQLGNIEAAPPVPDATTQSTTAVEGGPAPVMLALAGARPNPTRGPIQVWLTLPSRERATLELLDIAGRRVAHREVGELGPGAHLVTLALSPAPRAGLYFLRLKQGDRELTGRVALIR